MANIKKTYKLLDTVKIDGVWMKKGDEVSLTKKKYEYYKSINKV